MMLGNQHGRSRGCPVIFIIMKYIIIITILHILLTTKCSAQINRPPEFLKGGDMNDFAIMEDTPVGTSVYTLRGSDHEGTRVSYYISGDVFSVDRDSGVVRLVRPLDREKESSVDVIISITDQRFLGRNPNTISIQREVTILDQNDNSPKFLNLPYTFSIDETTPIGSVVFEDILVTDADIGENAEIKLSCSSLPTFLPCQKFEIQQMPSLKGQFKGEIILKEKLDYEDKSEYTILLLAEDMGATIKRNSSTTIVIEVNDVQDQAPVFQNAPFTATVQENSDPGTSVLNISFRDGDTRDPRDIILSTEQDYRNFFRIGQLTKDEKNTFTAVLETRNAIDREDEEILSNGGLFSFKLKATELIDGEPIGESTTTNVTVVVGDVNDQLPVFNEEEFNIVVPEDIGTNTPLPGLNIIVSDMDVGDNAKFSLRLENVLNSEGVFSVFPTTAVGRTPVIIRVADGAKLDYEIPEKRVFVFKIKAEQGQVGSTATVTVTLSDANDNAPLFASDQYLFQVPESASPGTSIFTLPAFDADSGDFGKVTYTLKGFGSDKLHLVPDTGEIIVSDCGQPTCLDYEVQRGYSLTYEAADGGGRVTAVNVFIEILDINDNAPQFTKDFYSREVQENAAKILPPIFIKATDVDGPSQGGGKVTYKILSTDLHDSEALQIDPESGEVTLQRPLKFSEVPNSNGVVTVNIETEDFGHPPLSSRTKLLLRVKKENDGAPEFVNQPYKTTVPENAPGGSSVYKVTASDPDGPDSAIQYFIHHGTKDNFVIDEKSGIITVASGADLDRDVYGTDYQITVQAVDSGSPVPQTATATLLITVEDVNNKPPVFLQESYIEHIAESLAVGEEVITVAAVDPDKDAKLRYAIIEPILARDKTGSMVKFTGVFNYKEAFKIDSVSGRIVVNKPLDYNSASVIILTVEAIDLNALSATSGSHQKATVEVTVYIKAEGEMNPVFSPPWTQANPVIEITVPEEAIIGSTLLTVSARDPLTHQAVTQYEKLSGSDPDNYVSVSPVSGVVALNRRLDFDELPEKYISFKVRATIGDLKSQRFSEATVLINVQDINDNSPVFFQNSYQTSILESAVYPQTLLTVLASDKDSQGGFGTIRYSVSGEGSNAFDIDETMGNIYVKEDVILDRETHAVYNLQVTATDNPNSTTNQRRTSVLVVLKLLDENDNAPKFIQEIYTAVVPENVPTYFHVITVKALDSDSGNNGEVYYAIADDLDDISVRYFSVDSESGVVSVVGSLSGKGRSEPYKIRIRATDKGTPPLHSECHLLVVVSDISTNDGVPQFIRPSAGEVAYVQENVTVGSDVFQVVAFDPDNPNTANGKVAYKLLDDHNSADHDYEFTMDAATGIIKTSAPLDREKKANYTMIIVAYDFGFPPQEAQSVLRVFVLDVDDSDPQFTRPIKSQPIQISLKEEVPVGTIVGKVQAVDNDTAVNSIIDYYIVGGNEDEYFGIRRSMDNEGEIIVQKRIDRENVTGFTLTIKVSKPSVPLEGLTKSYDYWDLSETQLTINIEDIDDNPPAFETSSYVLGAKVDTEIDTELVTLQASDPDSSSGLVTYHIKNTTFIRPSTQEISRIADIFQISLKTGTLRNIQLLGKFVGGYFDITVEANSGLGARNMALATVKIYILQDRDLLKFVFYKRPNEVKKLIPQFQKDFKSTLAQPVSLNIYDTQFYTRSDGSLDFESTSSCFQLLENNILIEPKKVKNILDQKKSPNIVKLYNNYSVVAIESCAQPKEVYKMSWSEVMVLVIAAFIAVTSFIVSILICIMHSRYKEKLKRSAYFHSVYMTNNGAHPPILSPAEQQRIYEWQELNAPLADAASFRSYPTLR